jgi:ribonuclease HII
VYKIIGIDEAGKGPVIGSMFIGFSIKELNSKSELNNFQKELKNLGVKDSKLITPKKRTKIYEKLKEIIKIKYVQLTPAIIDGNNSSGGKLNELEIKAITQILNQEKPNLIIIDALTARPDKFKEDIKKHLTFECKIISENKADTKYEIVGAASIIAKELREKELKEIKENIHINCGSGYPSDPKTKEFLKKHWNNKEFDFIFRKSWATYKNIAGKRNNKSLLDY